MKGYSGCYCFIQLHQSVLSVHRTIWWKASVCNVMAREGGGQLGGISVENGWMALFCFIYLVIFMIIKFVFVFHLCVTNMLLKCITPVSVEKPVKFCLKKIKNLMLSCLYTVFSTSACLCCGSPYWQPSSTLCALSCICKCNSECVKLKINFVKPMIDTQAGKIQRLTSPDGVKTIISPLISKEQ